MVFLLLLVLMALTDVGCLGRSPDPRLFSLGESQLLAQAQRAPGLAVVVGPVRIPAYLARPQIVRRMGAGELQLNEGSRWIGSVETNLIRALEKNLRRELGSDQIVGYPTKAPFPLDYRVRLHVDELVADSTNALRVEVRWAIVPIGAPSRTAVGEESVVMPELASYRDEIPLADGSVEALVAAHDRALATIARAIADQLVAAVASP